MRRKTIVFILFLVATITVAVLGYMHILSPTVSRSAVFAALAGYIYYRFSGKKEKSETIYGITEGDEEIK
ncbi:MAG: hypothetical protein BGO69_06725 [Bacteroidetes bacterium 46-16]|nr:MAG: hypothetical protein BGO69_06725 [Bacteroidetes bacterium 46-16]